MPKIQCQLSKWKHVSKLQLADPHFMRGGEIDILLGAEVVPYIMYGEIRRLDNNSPVAQNSMFGWILSGRITMSPSTTIRTYNATCQINETLQKFWKLEEPVHSSSPLTIEEKECESHFIATHTRQPDGRFMVRLPFNSLKSKLGESRQQALIRLFALEKRFRQYPEKRAQYIQFMEEYEALGHMKRVDDQSSVGAFYLPHHFVMKEDSTTTKLRVVFDGSAKTSTGISLNDTLKVGATVQSDLLTIILKFRYNIIAIKADANKMYRQFLVHPDDVQYQRILWRAKESDPIQEYILLTITYGTASAPHQATRCLNELADQHIISLPVAAKKLKEEAFVDDLLSGGDTTNNTISLVEDLNTITKSGKIELRKWCCSDPEVLKTIPPQLREQKEVLSFGEDDDDDDSAIKALGIQWSPVTDQFQFSVKPAPVNKLTKRHILREVAKIFDPVGWLSPIIISAKMLLQSLWIKGLDWDEEVADDLAEVWTNYQADLIKIKEIRILRCVITSKAINYQIHGFCDASERAYAAAIYLRVVYADHSISSNLLISKTRVAPIHQISLPRLELCGANLLTDTLTTVKKSISFPFDLYCWTDSTVTLRWISSHSRRWKTYVANRVSAIQSIAPPEVWHHVKGTENPADLPSRGVSCDELTNSTLWWHGPEWLSSHEFPISTATCNEEDVQKEERRGPLSLSELKAASSSLIRWCQLISFPTEFQTLKETHEVKLSSKLNQLTPFIDNYGIIRVGGRLQNSSLPESSKYPIILPHDHPLTTLIIRDVHERYLHAGFTLTLSTLRRKYWILKGRDQIRFLLRKCITCKKITATTAEQLMGSLPHGRVTPSRPFLSTGVDFAGHFAIKVTKGRFTTTEKTWFAIFVCLATKAIHLEVVTSLSTEAFIACYERFISRRGVPAQLQSDCGTNFIGADREMKKMLQLANHQISSALANHGTQWTFNSPSAPHQGGLWEAGVKSVKYHLKRVIGSHTLTMEQFMTLLCKVEACLNSRPLCALSSDPADLEPLTPGHFLIGTALTHIPEPDMTLVKQNRLSYWEQVRQLAQHFWNRWVNEYLSTLQQRFKWTQRRDNLQPGDLVLVKDETLPLTKWKTGRIIETFKSAADGLVRNVLVKTAVGQLNRPIQKLIPLISNDDE